MLEIAYALDRNFAEPLWLCLLLVVPFVVWLRIKAPISESRIKRLLGILFRSATCALLIVALAGPLEVSVSDRTDIVFVLDVSNSIDQDTVLDAKTYINRVLESKGPQVRVGLVVFGAEAAVERLLNESEEPFTDVSVQVNRGGTNIARAIEIALGTFQSEGQRRLVLLSDGQENIEQALSAAQVARSIGVTIDTVPLARNRNNDEILIRDIAAPLWVFNQEPFELEVKISSQLAAHTHLIITRNGSPLDEAVLTLQPGLNSYVFIDQADEAGLYEYEAIINSDQDRVQENNRYQTFVQVKGESRILHAVGDEEAGQYLTSALRAQGLLVDELAGVRLPATMHELVEYDLLILNNVSALDMSMAKMELIEQYVRDAGGGLIILGGDKSYGAGGYLETPVERALPITMDIKTAVEIPSLAVTIIIDRSGSMASREKLAIAKDAAFSALQILKPIDTVGVLVFADQPEWSVEPRKVGDRRAIVERLRLLESGGGTNLYIALEEAHRVMQTQSARIKHMILLSDGLSDTEGDVHSLVSSINNNGITLSSVAFGSDADQSLMQNLAELGGGRFYYTRDAGNVPRIFTSETLVVARNLIVEEQVRPQLLNSAELLKEFKEQAFPVLSGYQRIFAKPAAQVLLVGNEEDPLLASWRYGLGRSVAFASDLSGRWSEQWIQWEEFGRFVAQTARWTMRRHGTERLMAQFEREGHHMEVFVDALDRDDRFINGLELEGSVSEPAGSTRQFLLQQISPGRYKGVFELPQDGRYYVSLSGKAGDLLIGPETYGLALPYSPEYLDLEINEKLLATLADETSGQLLPLNATSIPRIISNDTASGALRDRVWWPALLAALIFLIVEIAVRKMMLPKSWQRALTTLRKPPGNGEKETDDYDALFNEVVQARVSRVKAPN